MKIPHHLDELACQNDITVENFNDYGNMSGLRLQSIDVKNWNELKKCPYPVIFKMENSNTFHVYLKSSNINNPISEAWQCCPTQLPVVSRYFSFVSLITFIQGKELVFASFLALIASFTPLLNAMISGYVFSHINQENCQYTVIVFTSFLILIICSGLLNLYNQHLIKSLSSKIIFLLMTNLINRIFHYPVSILKSDDSGSLIQRISDYEIAIAELLNKSLSAMFGMITLLILLAYIYYCNPGLSLICLLSGIVFAITKLLIYSRYKIYISSQMTKQGKILLLLNEMFLQIHKIRIFNIEYKMFYKWFTHLVSIKNDLMNMQKLEIIQEYIGIIISSLAILCLYLVLYFSTTQSNPYFILQCIVCAGFFSNASEKTLNDIFSLLVLLPGLNRIKPMELHVEKQDFPSPQRINTNAAIKFSNVYVANEKNTQDFILKDISFIILPGEFIGFIGKSGAGKSTIFKLLTGLISPTKGDILINGNSIRNFNIRHLRKQFGVVLQHSNLLPGTIYSNICGHARISMDEAWEIAKYIGLDEEINNMPMKMHTYISDNNGESISGGQKQKILIARALAVKPGIILMDEATSALDNNSQNIIYQYLKSLNITRIVIAHRYSTLADADRIYRIDKGSIVESCQYKDLCCQTEILSL